MPETTTALAKFNKSMFIESSNSTQFPIVVKNEILLDARFFLNPTRMQNAIDKSVKAQFLAEATTPESIIAHELGHVVTDLISANRYGLEDSSYITANEGDKYIQYLNERMKQTTTREIVNDAYKKYEKSASFDEFLNDISGYAASKNEKTNEYQYEEVCSEAYQDYYSNGINCSKASKLVMEEIVTYYNRYCK